MHYIIALNTLQLKRKFALIEPFMGFIQSSKELYKLGIENLLTNEEIDGFCENISVSVQNVHQVNFSFQFALGISRNETQISDFFHPTTELEAIW